MAITIQTAKDNALHLLEELEVRSYTFSKLNGYFDGTDFNGLTESEQIEVLTDLFASGFIKIQ